MKKEEFINERTRIISEMLDNPDTYGIYPTTKCFNELDDLFDKITSDNSDYAKLPSLHEVMDIVRPDGAGQEIPEIVRRVYETIKKLGNFA